MAGWAYSQRAGDEAAFRGELVSVVKLWHNPLHHQHESSRLCERTPHNLGAEGSLPCRSVWTAFPRGHLPHKWCKRRETLVFRRVLVLPFFALIHHNDANPSWNHPTRLQPVFITFCAFPVTYKFLIGIGLQGFRNNSKYCNCLSHRLDVLQNVLFFFNKTQ